MKARFLAHASAAVLVLPLGLVAVPALAQSSGNSLPPTPQRFAPGGSAGQGNIAASGTMTWNPPPAGGPLSGSADTTAAPAGTTGVGPTGILTAPGGRTTAREGGRSELTPPGDAPIQIAQAGQPGGAAESRSGGQQTQNQTGGQTARSERRMDARVERHIADLHRKLQITQAEQPQWQAFADAMRQNAEQMRQFWDQARPHLASMDAAQGLQFYARMTQLYAEGAQRLVQPFDQLYQAMPPQQRQVADRVFRQFRERHAEAHRRHRRHHANQPNEQQPQQQQQQQ